MNTTVDSGVPKFDPKTFGTEHSIARLGAGSVGGKAVGSTADPERDPSSFRRLQF